MEVINCSTLLVVVTFSSAAVNSYCVVFHSRVWSEEGLLHNTSFDWSRKSCDVPHLSLRPIFYALCRGMSDV